MIFDPIPKKRKKMSGLDSIGVYRDIGAHHSSAGSVQTKAKKELEDALPTNRDYRTLNRMQIKFQNWRKLESGLDESDGEVMGRMLMANSSNLLSKNRTKKMKERRVKHFFEEFHAMKTMKMVNPFFEKMILAVIVGENGKEDKGRHNEVSEQAGPGGGGGRSGTERPTNPLIIRSAQGKLAVLTVHDGNHLGASFKRFVGVTATEEGAFASWVKMHPAMNELSLSPNHKFFKPLMLTIGKYIRHSATKMKLLISVSASLASMLDVTGDLYTIWYYRSIGLQDAANLMTVFVALSIGLQIFLVIAIHRKNKRRMLVELLGTVTFTKQGVNFWRTYTNARPRGHELIPPVSEMMVFQGAEVFGGE